MAEQSTTYNIINLFDWTNGIIDRTSNPLAAFEKSLSSANDIDASAFGLKTRDGSSYFTGFEQGSVVRFLAHAYLPTSRTGYLIAQAQDSSQCSTVWATRIYHDNLDLDPDWIAVFNLGPDAGVISVAPLNDRVVITEGKAHPPLVFSGCLDPSGSDWAVPKAAMVTYNNGQDWDDITDAVCDTDPETLGIIEPFSANGWIAVCCDTPYVQAFHFDLEQGGPQSGSMIVEGYSHTWQDDGLWADSTSALGSSGFVRHSGDPFKSAYHSLNNVPGFWFRFRFSSPFTGASIRRILFQSPCQELSIIGDGMPQTPLGFVFHDVSENSLKDFSVEVSDYAYPTFARLNDGSLDNPTGMNPSDAIYIGYLKRFSSVNLTLHNDFSNAAAATMSGHYWNGTSWAPLNEFSDQTLSPTGATLSTSGTICWKVPDDWKHNRPVNQRQPHGYWVKLTVSANLTPKTYITEAALTPVMDRLKKSKLAITARERIILLGRSDAPDQIDISRPLEEYGFFGEESASFRIGGQGEITAAVEAFNQGFIAKSDDWYLLNGYSPSTFSVERAEAAGQAPINSRVIVRAPHAESDMKNLMGLYYLNRSGAWYFAGLKVYRISENVSWWDESNTKKLRIDTDNLNLAVGAYLPEKNRIIWAVPMKGPDLQPLQRNNRLIIYDLNNKAWHGPYSLSISAMTLMPRASGSSLLLGSDYSGRILRLFDPMASTDENEPIIAGAQTQWLNFGAPHIVKRLRSLIMHGKSLTGPITLKIYIDGSTHPAVSMDLDRLQSTNEVNFLTERRSLDIQGRFFKFSFYMAPPAVVHGAQIGFSPVREWSHN